MKIEDLSLEKKIQLVESHLAATCDALVEVFALGRGEASERIERFRERYKEASLDERVFVLHRDPVALAADMTGLNLDDPKIKARLEPFNEARERVLEMANPFT